MERNELLTLIAKCREGDRWAQEKLVAETQNKVYYHCKRFLKNEQDAQDATQDVLITMLTSLDKLRQPAAFWGWLNGITANRCKHILTQGTREWQIPEDDEGNSMLDSIETLDDQTVPDKAMDNAETRRLILDIIDGLPAEQRMTVTFFYYDEMSVKAIAQAMEVSEGTVKSRLNYARKAIKAEVEKLEKKDGTKLYSVSILPFLAYFLRMGAQSQVLSPSAAAALTQGALAATGTTAPAATATAGAGTTTAAAAGTKVAGAAAAKIVAVALAGTLTVGGVGAGVYMATHQEPEPTPDHAPVAAVVTPTPEPAGEPAPGLEPSPTPGPPSTREPGAGSSPHHLYNGEERMTDLPSPEPAYAAYAQKVAELDDQLGQSARYELCCITADDLPELVVINGGWEMSIYTYADGMVCTVLENQSAGRLGFPSYYSRQNIIVEQYSSMADDHMEGSNTYYRIGEDCQWEQVCTESWTTWSDPSRDTSSVTPQGATPPVPVGSSQQLQASQTAQELLESLE